MLNPGQQLSNGSIVISYYEIGHNHGIVLAMLPKDIHTPYVCWLVDESGTYAGNYYQSILSASMNFAERQVA